MVTRAANNPVHTLFPFLEAFITNRLCIYFVCFCWIQKSTTLGSVIGICHWSHQTSWWLICNLFLWFFLPFFFYVPSWSICWGVQISSIQAVVRDLSFLRQCSANSCGSTGRNQRDFCRFCSSLIAHRINCSCSSPERAGVQPALLDTGLQIS